MLVYDISVDLRNNFGRGIDGTSKVLCSSCFGGLEAVVKFLLSKTELTCTAAGKHPLHFAAMAGNPSLICLVRHFMKKQGITEADIAGATCEKDLNSIELQAPLTLAIQMATMKMKDLVLSAEPSSYSLKLFMKDCPEATGL